MIRKLVVGIMSSVIASLLSLITLMNFAAAENEAVINELYEAAQAEGEVVIWGPTPRELDWIQAALDERFPGIEVTWNADLRSVPKIIQEAQAGRSSVDILSFSMGGTLAIVQRELNDPSAKQAFEAFDTPADEIFFGGSSGATHNLVYSVVYNRDLVDETDLPTDWMDLTDPKYADKLVASPFLLPRLMGFLATQWGRDATAEWATTLIEDRNLMVTSAPREGILNSGERVISITDFASLGRVYDVEGGVPTDFLILDIAPAVQFVATVIKDAPHPNAAKLVAAFMTTEAAKQARENRAFSGDVRPGSGSMVSEAVAAKDALLILESPANMQERAEHYQALSPIVRGPN